MRLIRLVPILSCGLLALAAGCSSGNGAAPPPSSDDASTRTTASGPTVADPLDVAKVTNDPCSGLTAAQLAPYMGTLQRSTKSQYNNGTGCLFEPVDGNQPSFSVLAYPSNSGPGTLTQASFPWQESAGNIAGYPAEHQSQGGASGPVTGDCQTMVAVSDQASVAVYMDDANPNYQYNKTACVPTDKLAAELIANIKGGG